jgi:hypothetical protein
MQLATDKRVQLILVPGHEGVAANETAHSLDDLGSERPITGPEPAYSISMGIA